MCDEGDGSGLLDADSDPESEYVTVAFPDREYVLVMLVLLEKLTVAETVLVIPVGNVVELIVDV